MCTNFKYCWCWECDAPTVDLGDRNTCCSYHHPSYQEQLEIMAWSKLNERPTSPTPEEIDNQLILHYSEPEKLIIDIFKGFSYGKWYWCAKKWADKIKYTIPTYEDLCIKYGVEPIYDCKTGEKWQIDENKEVYLKQGWISEENFQQEEIPYKEFCKRRRISKIMFENKNNFY